MNVSGLEPSSMIARSAAASSIPRFLSFFLLRSASMSGFVVSHIAKPHHYARDQLAKK